MHNKYQTAIVGNKDTILGFKALGLHTFNANTSEEAFKVITKIKSKQVTDESTGETKPAYAIIFVTEDLVMNISRDDYKKIGQDALPAIIPVPSSSGTTGYGIKRIGKMVEQAVGSDIFGDE